MSARWDRSSATEKAPWSPQGKLASNVGSRQIIEADVTGYSRQVEADDKDR